MDCAVGIMPGYRFFDHDGTPFQRSINLDGTIDWYAPVQTCGCCSESNQKTFLDYSEQDIAELEFQLTSVKQVLPGTYFEYHSPFVYNHQAVFSTNFRTNGIYFSSEKDQPVVLQRSINFGPWLDIQRVMVTGCDYLNFVDFTQQFVYNGEFHVMYRLAMIGEIGDRLLYGDGKYYLDSNLVNAENV